MGLNKVNIGDFVEAYREPCGISNLTVWDVSGVNRDKEFFLPSKQVGKDTSKYKVVPPGYFACNLMHVGRDVVLPIALNQTDENKVVSQAYTVFKITDETIVLKEYFYILLNSEEMDRYFWFHTDSSVRDGMDWSVFCDIELEVPSIDIQKKYVDVYQGMQENLDAMNRGIVQMQNTCDIYMEQLLKTVERQPIGNFIKEVDERNEDETLGEEDVRGISTQKEFIPTKANLNGVSLRNYKVVKPGRFAYVADTSRRGDKMSLAFNRDSMDYLVSSITTMFEVTNEDIVPEYLFMFLRRPEFDRYARYNSWGSARETITWEDLGKLEIPIPSKEVQQGIVNIFESYDHRKLTVERLSTLKKNICPILIRGAIAEGGRS